MMEWNVMPNRAHNEAIHILATQGLFGGVAALVVGIGLVLAACRAWRRAHPDVRPLVLAVAAGLVGFAVQDFFSFTVAGCGTCFVTLAAVLVRLANPAAEPEPEVPSDAPCWWSGAVLVAGCLAALVLIYNVSTAPATAGLGMLLGCPAVLFTLLLVSLAAFRLESSKGAASMQRAAEGSEMLGGPSRVLTVRLLQLAVWAGAVAFIAAEVVQPWARTQPVGPAISSSERTPARPWQATSRR